MSTSTTTIIYELYIKKPVRDEVSSHAILEADLWTLSSSNGGNINMSSQEEILVDKESGTRSSIAGAGDCGQGGTFIGENGGLHSLRLANSFAKAPRLTQNAHSLKNSSVSVPLRVKRIGFCLLLLKNQSIAAGLDLKRLAFWAF